MSFYISNISKTPKPLSGSPFKTLDELYIGLIKQGWSEYSVFSHKQWNPNNKACGQCNGTVIISV